MTEKPSTNPGTQSGSGYSASFFYRTSNLGGYPHEQWCLSQSKEFELRRFEKLSREIGGLMLNITGLNRFFFVRDFHYMRCKYDKVLSIIHQQLDCEPEDGDVFIVMSKDLRLVRFFGYGQMSRMSLTNWLEKDSTHFCGLISYLKNTCLEKDSIVNCDETWCRVKREGCYRKKYIWCLVNNCPKWLSIATRTVSRDGMP